MRRCEPLGGEGRGIPERLLLYKGRWGLWLLLYKGRWGLWLLLPHRPARGEGAAGWLCRAPRVAADVGRGRGPRGLRLLLSRLAAHLLRAPVDLRSPATVGVAAALAVAWPRSAAAVLGSRCRAPVVLGQKGVAVGSP